MTEGEAVIEIQAPKPSLVREAGADECAVAIRILSGTAEWEREGGKRTLKAGDSLGNPGFRGGWIPVQDAIRGTLAVPAAYAWEAVVRRPDRRTSIAVRLPFGGRSWEFPLSDGLMGDPGSWLRIGATAAGGRLRLEVSGREAASCSRETLEGMQALSPRDRLVLEMAAVEGLPEGKMAEALGVAPASVHSLLARARRRLASKS